MTTIGEAATRIENFLNARARASGLDPDILVSYARGGAIYDLRAGDLRIVLGAIVADDNDEPATAPRSAWVVVPSSPGMPYSDTDQRRSGYNSVPCELDDALRAAANARDTEIHLAIPNITEAFRIACENHAGPPVFLIDEGNGNYTVIV